MEKIIIIGGGVAGLSCLNALLDKGIAATLFESGKIGTPKMCGEFLAPEAAQLLQKWHIGPLQDIQEVKFFVKNNSFTLPFPTRAGAFSRSEIEIQLAERALKSGAKIIENTSITAISPSTHKSPYSLTLSSGEHITAEFAIFATGKLGKQTPKIAKFPYAGIKTHIPRVIQAHTLLMYSSPDIYFGVVPVSETMSNCACLLTRQAFAQWQSGKNFFAHLQKQYDFLQHIDLEQLTFLEGQAPEFGLKTLPSWPNAYWIGDALATLPPAIGYGFAHSITSAVRAVEFYLQKSSAKKYQRVALKHIKPKLRLGKLFHKILLTPMLAKCTLFLLRWNTRLTKFCLKSIGY